MYRYRVKQNKHSAVIVASLFYAAAAVLLIASMAGLTPRALLQGLMLIMLTAAILVSGRYLFSFYEYVIEDTVGDYDLLIIRIIGQRPQTLCRMPLSTASGFFPVTSKDKDRSKIVGRMYDYTGNMFPTTYYFLTFADDSTTLKIEPDAAFAAAIAKLMPGDKLDIL